MKTGLAVLLLSAAACAQNSEEGKVVRYEVKSSDLKYTMLRPTTSGASEAGKYS